MKGPTHKIERDSVSFYRKYLKSRIIIFMVSLIIFHMVILGAESIFMFYAGYRLNQNRIPEENIPLSKIMSGSRKRQEIFQSQSKISVRLGVRRIGGIFSKFLDLLIIGSFFSDGVRDRLMVYVKKFKGIIRINSSHLSDYDNSYICITFLLLGLKSVISGWISSRRDFTDLSVSIFIQVFKSFIILPIVIWLFSSIYNKTRFSLIISAYVSLIILILITNCTSLISDGVENLEQIPTRELGDVLYNELVRMKLDDRIFWDKNSKGENAALVKTGSTRYIIIIGNLLKYGKDEFISFIAHEVGHADDFSTEKKLFGSVLGLAVTCAGIVWLIRSLCPRFREKGVSDFSVVVFLLLGNIYIFSGLFNMFYNNLYILSEINADMYAKKLGFGKTLGDGLYKLMVDNGAPLFHSTVYTYYAQDHPTVASRVEYLNK